MEIYIIGCEVISNEMGHWCFKEVINVWSTKQLSVWGATFIITTISNDIRITIIIIIITSSRTHNKAVLL